MSLITKKIKGKEVIFMVGRGENCQCADCPVLYGGECPYDKVNESEE